MTHRGDRKGRETHYLLTRRVEDRDEGWTGVGGVGVKVTLPRRDQETQGTPDFSATVLKHSLP